MYAQLPQIRSDVASRLKPVGPSVSITSAPAEGTIKEGEVEYVWKGSGGSGELQFSYCLVGWSKIESTGEVDYVRGFNSVRSPAWSGWTGNTTAKFCYVSDGIYTFHVRVKDSSGRVGVNHETRTFQGTAQAELCDGALLRGSAPAVYLMQRGLRRHVPNPISLEAYGLQWGNINRIADSSLEGIPEGDALLDVLADGNLLRGSSPEVYVMEGGLKRRLTSSDAVINCSYGWDAVYVVPDSLLESIASGDTLSGPPCPHLSPPDGALIKGSGTPVYSMEGGLKRHVVGLEVFSSCGYHWGNVNFIPDSSLDGIPAGDDLTGEPCP